MSNVILFSLISLISGFLIGLVAEYHWLKPVVHERPEQCRKALGLTESEDKSNEQ